MQLSNKTRKLEGKRVLLRRHERADYDLYAKWYGDPEVWRLTSWASEPLSSGAVRRLFEDRELSTTEDSFAILPLNESQPIGIISLMNVSKANESAELSIIVGAAEDRGRGYGSDAIRTILRYGFEQLGLHRIGLSVFVFNGAAISAYRKLGFNEEGRLRAAIKRDGSHHDALLMSVLEPEWRDTRG